MPEMVARLSFRATSSGRWRGRDLVGAVTLFLEPHEVVVRLEASGEELVASLRELRGATWRAGVLGLHLTDDSLQLSGGEGLDRAWHALSQRACTLPEVARTLRAFAGPGGRGAGAGRHAADRERFFSPLLQARRRLEGEEPPDWRVASFDAEALDERLRAALVAMALDRHADRPPHRRALEAGLLDACEALFAQLLRVRGAARVMHEADDALRFEAWREWADEVIALFARSDVAWRGIADVLDEADRGLPSTAPR